MLVTHEYAISPNDVNAIVSALSGYYVKSGCSVHPLGNNTVRVDAGTVCIGEVEYAISAADVVINTSPYPKKVIIFATKTGVQPQEGSPSIPDPYGLKGKYTFKPESPLFENTVVPLAEIWVDPSGTITAEDIFDYRIFKTAPPVPNAKASQIVKDHAYISTIGGSLSQAPYWGAMYGTLIWTYALAGNSTIDLWYPCPFGKVFNFLDCYFVFHVGFNPTGTYDFLVTNIQSTILCSSSTFPRNVVIAHTIPGEAMNSLACDWTNAAYYLIVRAKSTSSYHYLYSRGVVWNAIL